MICHGQYGSQAAATQESLPPKETQEGKHLTAAKKDHPYLTFLSIDFWIHPVLVMTEPEVHLRTELPKTNCSGT